MRKQTTESGPSIWNAERIGLAGLGGILGGIVLSLLSIGRTGVGVEPGSISIVYPLGYALSAIALLAGNARYKNGCGSRGNVVALLLALSLACYAVSTVATVLSMRVFGLPVGPFTSVISIAFLATRVFGTVYGVVLWRRTDVSRVAAGLFAAVLPAMTVLGPLTHLGVPAFGMELPIYLAFVAFSYGLWRETSSKAQRTP